ncbi:hypothetical protein [Streptomyces collinus]|uniref:hypothetical protein n=1 Tax=Streptomyces collinus TaxID=42684 RepID=UPI0036CAC9AD
MPSVITQPCAAATTGFDHGPSACGHDTRAEVVCSSCGEPLHDEDVAVRTGPGYPARLLDAPEVRVRFAANEHRE